MSDIEVSDKVLEILEAEHEPLRPDCLYEKLKTMQIHEPQSRRAVVDLAVQHKIEVTADRKIVLAATTQKRSA